MKWHTVVLSILLCTGCATTPDSAAQGAQGPAAGSMNHYLHSVILEREGKFEESLAALERAVADDPEALTLMIRLMWGYYRLGEYEKALEVSERTAERIPDDPGLWTLRGRILERLERHDESADALRRAAALSPENALRDEAIIEAELKSNDLVGALEVVEALSEAHPEDVNLRMRLALIHLEINDLDSARASLERVAAQAPDNDRAKYLLGLVCLELGDFAQAERFMAPFAGRPDEYEAAPGFLAAALNRQGKRLEAIGVLKAYHASRRSAPSDDIVLMYLAMREKDFATAASAAPPAGAPIFGTLMRAMVRAEAGEPAQPILETLDAVEGDVDAETPEYFGELRLAAGDEELREGFLAAFDRLRGDGRVSRTLETAYVRMQLMLEEDAAAARLAETALGHFGEDFLLHTYAALAYERLDDLDSAERHLRACLALRPDDHNTMNTLGYLFADADVRLEEAETLVVKALELDPNNPFYLDSLGWVYYRRAEYDKAIEYIRRALFGMQSDDPTLRDHLGDAYAGAGELEKALAEWEKALRLDPDHTGVREKIERARR